MPNRKHTEPITDEIDALIAQFDAADLALGHHLIDGIKSGPHHTQPPLTTDWLRTRILKWCRDGAVESEFDREAVRSIEMAVEHMDDDLIRTVGHELMARARAPIARVAAPVRSTQRRRRRTHR